MVQVEHDERKFQKQSLLADTVQDSVGFNL